MLFIATLALATTYLKTQQPVHLAIDLHKTRATVSPRLYGLMTEEINYSYDGGLYAELVRNRTFHADWMGVRYAFGYGPSYTAFAYSNLHILNSSIRPNQPLETEVEITNTGKLAGDEIAQAYITFPTTPGAPNVALRGFQRVSLTPGESKKIAFSFADRDLGSVTEEGTPRISAGDYRLSIGGGQLAFDSRDVSETFRVIANRDLPE